MTLQEVNNVCDELAKQSPPITVSQSARNVINVLIQSLEMEPESKWAPDAATIDATFLESEIRYFSMCKKIQEIRTNEVIMYLRWRDCVEPF